MVIHEASSKRIISPKIESEELDGTTIHHLFLPQLLRNISLPIYKKVEKIVSDFDPDLIHGHVMYPVGKLAVKLSAKLKLPMVFTEHWSGFKEINKDQYNQKVAQIVTQTAEFCSFILPVSEDLGHSIATKGIVTPQKVIYNSVDTTFFNWKASAHIDPFTFLHISNFDKRSKNTEGIVEAFTRLNRNARLIIAGDGDLERVKRFAATVGADTDRIDFLGTLEYREVAEQMKRSHCHVLFSNYENLPCVIAESLCCGLPNIATAVGGIPEMIDKSNGLMIQPGDLSALTSAMNQIIDNYSDYDNQDISRKAVKKYSYARIGREFLKIYQKITGHQ
jgi:glycosyltransferase involved in cell wall biosynthesis